MTWRRAVFALFTVAAGTNVPTPLLLVYQERLGLSPEVLTALFGLLLGLPSLRLAGDYLAIVTLGFGQIFVLLANSMSRVSVPWSEQQLDITGGPNGITNLDPIQLFGLSLSGVTGYFYLLLAALALVWLALHNTNRSRIGRAWRALREDALSMSPHELRHAAVAR